MHSPPFPGVDATPEQRRAYIRAAALELEREDKARAAPSGTVDLGIVLTTDEERELRAYAQLMDVDLAQIVEYHAAAFSVVETAPPGLKGAELSNARLIVRKHLPFHIKCSIEATASRREWRRDQADHQGA